MYIQGLAFTLKERQILGIHGLLPPVVSAPDEQKMRVLENVRRWGDSDLNKYIYLAGLLDRNEKLFYQVHTTDILLRYGSVALLWFSVNIEKQLNQQTAMYSGMTLFLFQLRNLVSQKVMA